MSYIIGQLSRICLKYTILLVIRALVFNIKTEETDT